MSNRLTGGFFRSAVESSLDSVRVLDLDGRLLFMNRGGLIAFEIDDFAPFAGLKCESLWPEPAASEIRFGISAALCGLTHRFDGLCPTMTGVEKWWDVFIAPVFAEDGALSAIMVTSHDMTEAHAARVAAERQAVDIARSDAALRSAFRIAHVGGWEVDYITRQALFSPELCELLGMPPMPPMPLERSVQFWEEADRARFEEVLDRSEHVPERMHFEGRSKAADGTVRWWRLFGEPVIENGRCVALRGAAQDTTDWRGMVERERAAVAAADAMSGFLATMSHELRTPLNGVLGMAQAMKRDLLSPEQQDRLAIIESSGKSLLSLLNDLLDLSKIEAGKTELEDGTVDVEVLSSGASAIFSALSREKNLGLDIRIDDSAKGLWRGDANRVRQVLHNLISNAVKFTDQGGVTIQFTGHDDTLVFEIADTGVGIPPEMLGRVFEKFVQADATTTRRYGGSGLGLAICHDLVTLMGGDITVRSRLDEGTAFTVTLPLGRAEQPARSEPARADAPAQIAPAPRVLAAEDNPINQIVLTTLLEGAGVDTTVVGNGLEAFEAWRSGHWDIVLMDIQMPVMDGVAAVKAIRDAERREGLRRTPVIAITANASAQHRNEYLAAGMDELVAKPIELSTLLRAMQSALSSQSAPALSQVA